MINDFMADDKWEEYNVPDGFSGKKGGKGNTRGKG